MLGKHPLKIRAWNCKTRSWVPCKSIEYDHEVQLWRHRRTWTDGSEDWMHDVEVCVNDVWLKMNNAIPSIDQQIPVHPMAMVDWKQVVSEVERDLNTEEEDKE